jgi:hypothetical protein
MVLAEDWGGRPLIDESGAWWLVPAVIALTGFFAGGMVAARGRTVGRGLVAGLIMAVPAVVLLVVADVVRRWLDNPTLPTGVVDLWVKASVAAVVSATLGALAGGLISWRARAVRSSGPANLVSPGDQSSNPAEYDGCGRI